MTNLDTIEVLLVEDEATLRNTLATALEYAGFEVLQAESGEEALTLLRQKPKKVGGLITDVNLGPVSGWEIARQARERNPAVPVIYMDDDAATHWASRGVPDSVLLRKPFAMAALIAALAKLRAS